MDRGSEPLRVQMKLWLETDAGALLGGGRAELLEAVERLGSLNKAAKSLSMSYRSAWGRLKRAEEAAGTELLVRRAGRRGYDLTPLGTKLLSDFREWRRRVEAYALAQAREIFDWEINPPKK
ncbi:MAG: winged helix-turn-helix domain-containing protein [Desulfovibrionaceae bacterium]